MKSTKIASFGLAVTLLAGCAGPGEMTSISVDLGGGKKATIYAHNQQWPSWLLATDELALNFVVKDVATPEQLTAVAGAEKACRVYTKTTRPNELVSVFLGGTVYAAQGFVFGGLGATEAFKGASFTNYGTYNGIAYGGGGMANAVIQMGGKTYTFQNCGREVFDLFAMKDIRILQTSPY